MDRIGSLSVAVIGVAGSLVLLVQLPAIVALPLLLVAFFFCPGFLVLLSLDPRSKRISLAERIALAPPLSLAVLVPVLLLVAWLTDEVGRPWTPVAVAVVCAVLGVVCAVLERVHAAQSSVTQKWPRVSDSGGAFLGASIFMRNCWRHDIPPRRVLAVGLLLPLAAVGIALAWVNVADGPSPPGFTEFYAVDPRSGQAVFASSIPLGRPFSVRVGVSNREHQRRLYFLEVKVDGKSVQEIGPFMVEHGQVWEDTIHVSPSSPGRKLIELVLYVSRQDSTVAGSEADGTSDQWIAYRHLHFWLDVT
jgi:uncharacterized membrane protein